LWRLDKCHTTHLAEPTLDFSSPLVNERFFRSCPPIGPRNPRPAAPFPYLSSPCPLLLPVGHVPVKESSHARIRTFFRSPLCRTSSKAYPMQRMLDSSHTVIRHVTWFLPEDDCDFAPEPSQIPVLIVPMTSAGFASFKADFSLTAWFLSSPWAPFEMVGVGSTPP